MSIATHRRGRQRPPAEAPATPAPESRREARLELAGYVLLTVALAALLAHHVLQADGFFLDDWLYTHAAEYIGEHAPGAIWGDVPNWTRGAQRLYPVLLAPAWSLFDPSAAYTISHVVNVLLLASSVVPAALLARRFVDGALMRVLAVALAVVLPSMTVGATLLTENLAMPLLLWAVYLIARTAERPTLLNQAAVLATILALTLTRLNLAATFGALLLTVAVAEGLAFRDARGARRAWLPAMLRRRALMLVAAVVGIAGAAWVGRSGGGALGAYGNGPLQPQDIWAQRELALTAAATYTRSMIVGAFVFPFALGLAGALAAARGAAGRRGILAAVAALSCFALALVVIAGYTRFGAQEERYAFFLYPPVALFAVVAIQHLRRIPLELVVAGLATLWVLGRGALRASGFHYHFFDAPAGAFWNRVVEHRLVRFENGLPGWLPGSANGEQVIAFALVLLVAVALVARFWPRAARLPLAPMLVAGLAACALAQGLALNYSFNALMNGFSDAPGGYAGAPGHDADRFSWIDDAVPDGAAAAHLAPMPTPGSPYGGAESTQYWNRSIDAVVAARYSGAPVVASAGHHLVESPLEDGVATWAGPPGLTWLATARDDPRAQFAGRVTPSPSPALALVELEQPVRGIWAATGLEPDGYVPRDGAASMTLAREPEDGVRAVRLRLRGADELPGRASFRITRPGADPVTGRVRPGKATTVELRAPACEATCAPLTWRLTASGRPAQVVLPVFGAPPPPRPVQLKLIAARLLRE